MEDYDQTNKRMSGMFRANAPIPGIQPVAGTIGRKPDGPDKLYGTPARNIDIDFDEFSPKPDGSGGGQLTFWHPFRVYLSDISDPSAPEVSIISESRMYTVLSPASAISITSLTTAITLTSTTRIWIKGTVSSLSTSSATITTTNPSNLITTSGGAQTEFHVLVGKVTSGSNADAPGFDFTISGTPYHFEQTLFNHLLIESRCNSGTPVIYPFPFTGTV